MLTKEQREQRKKLLGSSDVAAIMGFDPFRNAYDVFLEKTDKLEPQKETTVMKRGKYLEPAILNFAEDVLGKLERNPANLEFTYGNGVEDFLISHPDALFDFAPVEAKSQGAYSKEIWGDENTDQVPDRVIIQCHVHLMCTNKSKCYVPVYLPYREFQMFFVNFAGEIGNEILASTNHFWFDHVQKDIPPEDVVPDLAVVKRVRREPKTIVKIYDSLWSDYLFAQEAEKKAQQNKNKTQAELLAALGMAEAGKCGFGLVTYYEQIRKEYTVPESKFRTLRFKPKETKNG